MDHDAVVAVNPDNFEREVLDSPVPVLIQFYTKKDDPALCSAVPEEFEGRLKIARVDLDDTDNESVAEFYGISGAPASLMLRPGGYPIPVEIGEHPIADLSLQVDAALFWAAS